LEWLQLVGEAANRQRTQTLLENTLAARGGQVTADGFKDIVRRLEATLKNK